MPEPTIHNILSESFPKTGKENWLSVASQELGEKNQIEKLTWGIDELNFSPYYEKKTLENLTYLKKYQARSHYSWENLPQITVSDVTAANKIALQCLVSGADGVLFDVTRGIDFNINHLMEGIDGSACSIYFFIPADAKIATKILAYADHKKYDLTGLTGSIFWETFPDIHDIPPLIRPGIRRYHPVGITIPPASVVEEISKSLQQAVHVVDMLTNKGIPATDAFNAISLSFYSDENFIRTIAKLKAVRILWYQLSQAFGITNYLPEDLHIHVRSGNKPALRFGPRAAMIKNTTDALSAVLGGCNALTLEAEDKDSEMMRRIALNVSNILKEESLLDKVCDPVSGAYAIEAVVNEISQAAWKDFQNNMRS